MFTGIIIGALGLFQWQEHQNNQQHFTRLDAADVRHEQVMSQQQIDIQKMREKIFPSGNGGLSLTNRGE